MQYRYTLLSRVLFTAITAFILAIAVVSARSQTMTTNNQTELLEQVKQAFYAAENGEYDQVTALANQGSAIIPILQPYLSSQNEIIRLQTVALLANFPEPESIPLLGIALTDPMQDIRSQAATLLYQRYDPLQLAKDEALGQILQASINQGNDAAAAILLLAYFPTTASQQTLKTLATNAEDSAMTELFTWSPVVPVHTVIHTALSRMGNQDSRLTLLQMINAGEMPTLVFLLDVLREIDSPEVLHQLASKALTNSDTVNSGLPSGITPQRRVQDLAVDAFVARLNLVVDFVPSEQKRYSEAEIAQVVQLTQGSVPK